MRATHFTKTRVLILKHLEYVLAPTCLFSWKRYLVIMDGWIQSKKLLLSALWIFVSIGNSESSGLFASRTNWMKETSKPDDFKLKNTLENCFSIRGGADDVSSNNEKIKGVCIGIDLGTTYRYYIQLYITFNDDL